MCKSVVSERKKTSSSGKEELSNDDELSETRETPVMISRDPKQKRKHIAKERRNTITATEEEEEGYKRPQKHIYIYIYIYIHDARTVGPAFATINTVSPLGTALTVPRSHPVTGIPPSVLKCLLSSLVLMCADKQTLVRKENTNFYKKKRDCKTLFFGGEDT